jgi:hypothetical protein
LKNGKKKASAVYKVTATTSGKPDKDTLVLICQPNKQNTGCGTTTTTLPTSCKNDAGGPDTIKMIVLGQGTDLDNGWTGTSHNFPVIKDASLTFCATNCDNASDPTCDATAPTGAGTVNGETFGPPLPLIAGGVPVCVINRFSGPVNGTGNISTGEMTGTINLLSDVYASDATRVCPRCEGGTCDSGLRRGQPCTVDGSVTVTQSLASNKNFQLSKSCPPQGGLLSTLTIILPVTTGSTVTPGTGGSKPCREKEAQGVPVRDDNCGAAGCGSNNCTGDACATMAPDPSDPTHMVCVDVKGGTSQGCCNDNTAVACYQTRPGSPGIIRTGRPVPPVPLWDTDKTTYPKVSDGLVQVATFCEAATGASNVDTVTGLPGPGAVIFNTKVEWRRDNP